MTDVVSHADSLSSQMALQSYYMLMLGGVQNLLRDDGENRLSDAIDLGLNAYPLPAEPAGRAAAATAAAAATTVATRAARHTSGDSVAGPIAP